MTTTRRLAAILAADVAGYAFGPKPKTLAASTMSAIEGVKRTIFARYELFSL
jgi:hypothetical protein